MPENVGGRSGSALLSEAGAHPRRYGPRGGRGKNEARRDNQAEIQTAAWSASAGTVITVMRPVPKMTPLVIM